MTTEPTEGRWVARDDLDTLLADWPGVKPTLGLMLALDDLTHPDAQLVSVAECDRRVDAAVKAERDRCVTAIRDAFTKYAGLGRQWERDAVRAALAAIEHPDATGDTPRSTP